MGSVRIDIHRKERAYEEQFPMHTPEGVEVFLENYQYVLTRRLKGDLDASLMLLDFEKTRNQAPLTKREQEVIYWRFEREFTERETAKALGITIGAVKKFAHRAILKIADTVAVQEGYKHAERGV
jgi:DNA-directed RNA polymerase specialized sigma24 family protein